MSLVGQQLSQPESGWVRYNDIDPLIIYTPPIFEQSNSSHYAGTATYLTSPDAKSEFKFIGTHLRILGYRHSSRTEVTEIVIDGIKYQYEEKGSTQASTVFFEVTGLSQNVHHVLISSPTANSTNSASIDAIDINSDGELVHISTPILVSYSLIKSSNNILTLQDNEWIDTGLTEPLSQKDFEEYGMEDLSPLTIPTNKVVKTMDFDRVEGDGKIYRKTIDIKKYKRIDDIKTL